MPGRYVLGGAAIAAVTYYFYQQREQRHLKTTFNREGPGQYTGRKIDETAEQTKDKFKSLQENASRSVGSGLDTISSEGQRTMDKADSLYQSAKENTKQFGHGVKQTVVNAKDATEDSLTSAKDKFMGKEDDLDRRALKSLEGWSETAQLNADAYYDSVHSKGEEAKASLFSWGSHKRAQSEEALSKARDDAQKLVDEAQKKFDETKASWFSFKDDEKKKLHEEASKKLDSAKINLQSTIDQLDKWRNDLKSGRNDGGLYSWLRGDNISPEEEKRIAHTASRSLRGWGESAEQFARDEEDEINRRLGLGRGEVTTKTLGDPSAGAVRQIDSWSKWANKKYSSDSRGAQEFYNDAQEALKDAQNEVENSTKSWYKWGSQKSKEFELDAKKNLEDAQERLQKATDDLSKWGIDVVKDVNKKFWAGADDALLETKKGIDNLHDQAKDGLNDAQRWVKDQKH